jgi:hypothetical protein
MALSFTNKLEKQANAAGVERNTKESLKWFQSKLKEMSGISRQKLLKDDKFKIRASPLPGRMFHFFYDPKGKKTLPYYDRFPLIFLVEKAKGGFYGLNLHYLPHKHRAIFFDRLTQLSTNKKYDETTRIRMSYELLKGAAKLTMYKPCFKHYLTNHVKSNIVEIPADNWEQVLFLPTENFKKKTKDQVWQESRKMI